MEKKETLCWLKKKVQFKNKKELYRAEKYRACRPVESA